MSRGVAKRASNEPGYASERVDFLSVRDTLDWSLPPVWGLPSVVARPDGGFTIIH